MPIARSLRARIAQRSRSGNDVRPMASLAEILDWGPCGLRNLTVRTEPRVVFRYKSENFRLPDRSGCHPASAWLLRPRARGMQERRGTASGGCQKVGIPGHARAAARLHSVWWVWTCKAVDRVADCRAPAPLANQRRETSKLLCLVRTAYFSRLGTIKREKSRILAFGKKPRGQIWGIWAYWMV